MSKARSLADFVSANNPLADGTIDVADINGVTATADELNKLDGATVTTTEINHLSGATSAVQTQLDAKVETLGDLGVTATATELNYVDGVTSNIQTQFDNISVTTGSLTKSFASGETASITLSQAISPAPVVSVTKEVSQTGVSSKGAWDVATDGANYDRHDTAYNVTLTPNSVIDMATSSYDSTSFSFASQDNAPQAAILYNSGTKLLMLGNTNNRLFQYTLSTAYDISTASYDSVSFDYSSQCDSARDFVFSPSGDKLFIIDSNNFDTVFEYALTTPYDITTASYSNSSFSIASQDSAPYGLRFSNDGTKMFIAGVATDTLYQYSLSTAFDVSTASYDSVSFSVNAQEGSARSLEFSGDGTQLFITGTTTDTVYQYSLSTAFDLSTASYDSVSFSISSQATGPSSITFSPDYSTMYIVDNGTDTVYQYSVGFNNTFTLGSGSFASTDVGKTIVGNGGEAILTATDGSYSLVTAFNDTSTIAAGSWSMYALTFDVTNGVELSGVVGDGFDIANASYDNVGYSVLSNISNAFDVAFNNNGTKMYVASGSQDLIFEYDLSSGFDVSTAAYNGVSLDVGGAGNTVNGIAFNNDGSYLYVVGDAANTIYQYLLSTPFDLSTASYASQSLDVTSQAANPYNIAFNTDGTRLFVMGSNGDEVYQYNLSTGFSLSSASYSGLSHSVAAQEDQAKGLAFSADGTKMFVIGETNKTVYQYSLSTAFSINTASYDSITFSVSSEETVPQGITFNPDGSKMFIVGRTSLTVFQYTTAEIFQPTAQYSPAVTNTGGQIDTTYWTDINSMTADQTANDGQVYYAVSTDGRTTWSVIKDADGVRPIVRNNGGTWEYNSNATYGSTTWTAATVNSEMDALQEALTQQAQNRMDKTQLDAVADGSHFTLGDSLDLMIALYLGSNGTSPTSDGVSINYDAQALNQGAVLGTDYDYDFPDSTTVRITSNAAQNLKIRVV